MQKTGDTILFSASDFVGFLECEHLTTLALTDLVAPLQRAADDASAQLVQDKGFAHEAEYLASLRAHGLGIVEIPSSGVPDALARETRSAMREGADIIFQGALVSGPLYGRADFLRRVDTPSALGSHSYEVVDTKLARSAKAKFVTQLSFYSELLADAQGSDPKSMHLVLGDRVEQSFRFSDYAHYFREVRRRFLAFTARHPNATYPERLAFCPLCAWRDLCSERWVADDHLNQVAGMSRRQIERLRLSDTRTLDALARLNPATRVAKIQSSTLERLRSQAALQLAYRRTGERTVELLELDASGLRGFHRMPRPDPGDVFFDMEGDPFEDGGLEYLFGVRYVEDGRPAYLPLWAHDRAGERRSFEALLDFLAERARRFPGMHIYHYAQYEPAALKRLMSLHGTREAQVDDLLRRERFVDLYGVVREAMRTSQPGYSLKDLEAFYMPARVGHVKTAGASIVHYERWKTTGDGAELDSIRSYNEDDCRSTHLLRDWLLTHRPSHLPWFTGTPRTEEPEAARARSQRIADLERDLARFRDALVGSLPADRGAWSSEARMRELVSHLLDFHRRAAKPEWWAMYARQAMSDEELVDDVQCLGGLRLSADEPPVPVARSLIYTFAFPEQETKLRAGDDAYRTETARSLGQIVSLDERAGVIRIKIGKGREVPTMLSIGPGPPVNTDALRDAVWRFAEGVLADDRRFRAIRSLLRRDPPALVDRPAGVPIVTDGADLFEQALHALLALDDSYVFVQGPPGAGKTTIGSRLIIELLRRGKRVGVASNSHKAINHLLKAVEDRAIDGGFTFSGVKKSRKDDPDSMLGGRLIRDVFADADAITGSPALIAGTAWLFADPGLQAALDYLFIDEAGQVSLGNLVALGTAAKNIVLLGDQMQLGQPIQGVHPGRSGDSTLDYLLDGEPTVAPHRGIFLPTTWRMHDHICRFISDAVYDGRLHAEADNQRQRIVLSAGAHAAMAPTGIRFIPVVHEGCAQRSEAEADAIRTLFESLLMQTYVDRYDDQRRVTVDNILVVAPYNAQVNLLKSLLPDGARVGTIDRFQGQEADVVIVSMTTSSGDELPRNMEFLFDRNRLNVAISRARSLALVVCSPRLLQVRCDTPEQMQLVNTLCWVREYAERTHGPIAIWQDSASPAIATAG